MQWKALHWEGADWSACLVPHLAPWKAGVECMTVGIALGVVLGAVEGTPLGNTDGVLLGAPLGSMEGRVESHHCWDCTGSNAGCMGKALHWETEMECCLVPHLAPWKAALNASLLGLHWE